MDIADDLVPDISVVIPCLDEAANVAPIVAAVAAELAKAEVSYEIILIDNGSTDGTLDLIRALCAEDKRVRLIANNRNYGQMRSPTYGIYQASGRAVIGMCADFQDPPELLGQFIARWRAGVRIVLGVRESERASLIVQVVRAVGYGYLERFGDYKIIPGATGFGLYDRQVVDCLSSWREPEPFFRGMLVESGYSLETIPYRRPPRAGGRSKNNFSTLLTFALSALASSSKRLLRAPLYLAAAAMVATMLTLVASLIALCLGRRPWGMLLFAAIEANFALVFFFMGVIGDQVRLISERTRNAPLVIEKERINLPEHPR